MSVTDLQNLKTVLKQTNLVEELEDMEDEEEGKQSVKFRIIMTLVKIIDADLLVV